MSYLSLPLYNRQRKVLDNLNMNNEDKVAKLELNLAEAQMIAEDSDKKYDEVGKLMCTYSLSRAMTVTFMLFIKKSSLTRFTDKRMMMMMMI